MFTIPQWICPTSDAGFALISGSHLVRYDSEGAVAWNKTFENTRLKRVIQTADGEYVLTGSLVSADNEDKGTIIKTDENGNVLWNKTSDNGKLYAVVEFEGGYAFAGGLGGLMWFAETDVDGNFMVNQTYMQGFAYSILKTKDGSFIVSGSDQSNQSN